MRTTLTLDRDVEQLLKQEMRKAGLSFKETVNRAVRAGLHTPPESKRRKPYALKSRPLGFKGDALPGHVLAALEEVEDIRSIARGE